MTKSLFTAAVAAFALSAAACNKSEPGGPGASAPGGNKNDTFQVSVPLIPNSIRQGEMESIKVKLDRGTAFKQGVKLSAKAPDKVKAEFDKPSIGADELPESNLKITPAADAPIGDFKLTITATPDSGPATTKDVSFSVAAKK